MKIAYLDVDGILMDFNGYVLKLYEEKYNYKFPEGYKPSSWGMKDIIPGIEVESWDKLVPSNWPSFLKPINKARDFILGLYHVKDIRIILITSLNQNKQVFRLNNLNEHRIDFDEIYFTGYNQIKASVINVINDRLDPEEFIFVDDKLINCIEVIGEHKIFPYCKHRVYSIDMPYNIDDAKTYNMFTNSPNLKILPTYHELYKTILRDFDVI